MPNSFTQVKSKFNFLKYSSEKLEKKKSTTTTIINNSLGLTRILSEESLMKPQRQKQCCPAWKNNNVIANAKFQVQCKKYLH